MRSFPLAIIVFILTVLSAAAQTKPDFYRVNPDRSSEYERIGASADAGGGIDVVELNNSGIKVAMGGDFGRASKIFRDLIGEIPLSFEAHYNLGISLAAAGRYDEAVQYLIYATELNARSINAHIALGHTYFKLDDFNKSAREFRRTLDLAPRDFVSANDLAVALFRSGETAAAVAAINESLRLKSDFPDALNNRGMMLHSLGRYKEARDDFRNAILVRPLFPEAHNNLGATLTALGKRKEAYKSFEEAVRLRANWAEAIYNLAISCLNLGKRDDARKHLKSLEPLNSELATKLGKEFERAYVIEAPKAVEN